MKVVVVHNRYRSTSPSGEDRVVDQESAALRAAGHQVHQFTRSSDEISRRSAVRKALVPLSVIENPRAAAELEAALGQLEPDVVHIHNVFPLLSPSVLRACAHRSIPCVVTIHNYRHVCPGSALFRDGAPCRACVGRRFALPGVVHGCYRGSSLATVPVALSSAVNRRLWQTVPAAYVLLSDAQRREVLAMRLPATRCFVKGNFVAATARAHAPEDLVAYLGRLTEAKGLRVLMDAWDRYLAHPGDRHLRLAIAGSGPLEGEVAAWAAHRPSVDVLGMLDRRSCQDLVRRARAVVAPSEWPEPFGLVVAEAMASGVVSIATAHGAFADLIEDGVTGYLYSPGSPDALARALRRVAEASSDTLATMGDAAQRAHSLRFGEEDNVAQLVAIYRFALRHPRSGGTVVDRRLPTAEAAAEDLADVSRRSHDALPRWTRTRERPGAKGPIGAR